MTHAGKILGEFEKIEMRDEFISRLARPMLIPHYQPRYVIIIGGFPGSGKTSAASLISAISERAFHVQSNSARFMLGEKFYWKESVPILMEAVIEELFHKGRSLIVDGMLNHREMVERLADKHGAKIFKIAVTCDPMIAEQRARKRYADGKTSTFDDWRADNVQGYYDSIRTLAQELEKNLADIPDDMDGVLRVKNDGDREQLAGLLTVAWSMIEKRI